MKCALCNNEVVKLIEPLEYETPSLGKIIVPTVEFLECTSCDDRLLTPEQSDQAIDYIAEEEQKLINELPFCEFISANEAAGLLGVTKQAFSKHPKIRNGMIFSATIGDRKYFHKKSVELFKETGNGKFLLIQADAKVETILLDDYVGAEVGNIYAKNTVLEEITVSGEIAFDRPIKAYSDSWQSGFTTSASSSNSQSIFMGEKDFPPKMLQEKPHYVRQ